MRDAASESKLGTGSKLGSDAARKSAGGESKLGTGSLLGSDAKRLSAFQEIEANFAEQLRQQNVASAADKVGQVTEDNDDGTYTVELSAGGGTLRAVPAAQGIIVFVDSWYSLMRSGPGWIISGPSPYQSGNS